MANTKKKKKYGAGETLKDRAKRMYPMTDFPATHKKWKRTKEIIKKIDEGKKSSSKGKKCRSHQVLKGGKCVPKKIRIK